MARTVEEILEAAGEALSDYKNYADRLEQNRSIDLRVDKKYDPLSNRVKTDLAELGKRVKTMKETQPKNVQHLTHYAQRFQNEVKEKIDYIRKKIAQRTFHMKTYLFFSHKELPRPVADSNASVEDRVEQNKVVPSEPPVSKVESYGRFQTLHELSKKLIENIDFDLYHGKGSLPFVSTNGPENFGSTQESRLLVQMLDSSFVELLEFAVKYPKAGISFDSIIKECERAIYNCLGLCGLPARNQSTIMFQNERQELEQLIKKVKDSLKTLKSNITREGSGIVYGEVIEGEDSYKEETKLWNERARQTNNTNSHSIVTADFTYKLISDKIRDILGEETVLWRGEQGSLEADGEGDSAGTFATTKKFVLKEQKKFKIIADTTGGSQWETDEIAVRLVKIDKQASRKEAEKRNSIRIVREARVWSKMNHPNIIPLFGLWLDFPKASCPCPVSPWIGDDSTLQTFLASKPDTTVAERLNIMQGISSALAYMHDHPYAEVVHGDLKPDNILIDNNNKPYLCDFGCSHLLDDIRGLSTEPHGNPFWLAPERFNIEPINGRYPKPTCAADVYALGLIFLVTVCKKSPFGNISKNHLASKRAKDNYMLPIAEKDIPKEYYGFLSECWLDDPLMRPPAQTCLQQIRGLITNIN